MKNIRARGSVQVFPWLSIENNADYFSHRKEAGTTGRMLALIGFQIA